MISKGKELVVIFFDDLYNLAQLYNHTKLQQPQSIYVIHFYVTYCGFSAFVILSDRYCFLANAHATIKRY